MTEKEPESGSRSERRADVVRSMIDAENRLVNDRMAWLTTLQGLLFAALGFIWDKPDVNVLMRVLCAVGMLMATIVLSTLVTASKAQRALLKWWDAHKEDYDGPDVIGSRPSRLRVAKYVAPWSVIAMTFIVAWAILWAIRAG
jgi:hypothetical protein